MKSETFTGGPEKPANGNLGGGGPSGPGDGPTALQGLCGRARAIAETILSPWNRDGEEPTPLGFTRALRRAAEIETANPREVAVLLGAALATLAVDSAERGTLDADALAALRNLANRGLAAGRLA